MKELLKKAQKGDENAFLELFFRYEAQMYRIAYLHVKNEADALDVMQEVAYRTFKNIKSLKNIKYFKTWLTRITINCSIDHIRKNGKIVQLGTEYIEDTGQFSKIYEAESLLKVTLEDLMKVLDADEKNVVILKFNRTAILPFSA